MEPLTPRERDLVALGAAMGSNCIPCVEKYVAKVRTAGLTDEQIVDAIRLADQVRRVPAQKALDAAFALLGKTDPSQKGDSAAGSNAENGPMPPFANMMRRCCGQSEK